MAGAPQGKLMRMRVKDDGKSESRTVIVADRGSIFALTGNRADFHLVFNCETSAKVSLDDMYENYI